MSKLQKRRIRAESSRPRERTFTVTPHEMEWGVTLIFKMDLGFRYPSRAEALSAAVEMAAQCEDGWVLR